MADPTIGTVGTSTTSTGNTTSSTSRALASTTTGDLNLLVIDVSPLANVTDPGVPTIDGTAISTTVGGTAGGWTTLGTSWDTGSPGPRLTIVGRVRQAGDPASVTVAWASAGNHSANAVAIPAGGFDTSAATSWLEGAAIQGQVASSTAFPTPSLTTTHRGRLFAVYGNRTAGGPWTDSQGTLVTSAQSSSSANFALFDEGVQDPGTYTRTGNWTAATSVGNAAIFAIRSNVATGFTGTASLAGDGTLTASGTATSPGSVSLTGMGMLTAAGKPAAGSSINLSGSGALSGSAQAAIQRWLALGGKRFAGHRDGFYATYGEFTLAGFTALKNYNPQVAWNIDVWKTSDGEWVASHDQNTGRVLSGTSLDIAANTWASISGKTTLVGGNPVARIDDIVAIAPAGTIFFVDNKQGSNNAAFITKLGSLGLTPANTVHKSYVSASSTLTAMRNAGYLNWAYVFDTTNDMNSLASNNGLCDWIGFDYAGTQASWNTVIGYGKPSFAHILPDQAAQNTADTKAANAGGSNFGYMVSNVAAVVPQTGATGDATLAGSGALVATAGAVTVARSASLSGAGGLTTGATPAVSGQASASSSGSLSVAATPAATGAASASGAGSLQAAGTASASGTAPLSGAGVLTVTTRPATSDTAATSGSGNLTATATVSATSAASFGGLGSLTASASGNGSGVINLGALGVLAAAASQVTAAGTVNFAGSGSLTGATARVGVTGPVDLVSVGALTASSAISSTGTAALTGVGVLVATTTGPPPDPTEPIIRATSRLRLRTRNTIVRFNSHRGDLR